MAGKISDRLASLADRAPKHTRVSIQVLLARNIDAKQLATTLNSLKQEIDAAEYVSISGTVHGRAPLERVPIIQAMPSVEWIDLESHAALEELIDST
jgi:hypothetical protein